jgi:outer membrane protein TolC
MAITVIGCTAGFYERQADRQVAGIIKKREHQTIGYAPEAVAPTDGKDTMPGAAAYTKIPQTPIAPRAQVQVEPLRVELEHAPLGPKRFDWAPDAPTTRASVSYEQLDERIRQNLRLGPPSPNEQPLKLDFFDALRYGVEHSREYQTRMETLYVEALNVTLQRHLFEPRFFAGGSLEYTGGQRDVNYRSALNTAARAGVRQQLPYGGEIVAQGLVNFVNALNENVTGGEDASLAISASVPLLRGAGMINLEPLISGERSLVYQVRAFEDFRRNFVILVAQQYFRLLNLQQSVLDRRINYQQFVQLTERARALYQAGRITFLELQRSLQEVLTAEDSLIDAQEQYYTTQDEFKLLLGMPTDQNVQIVPVELDVDLPQMDEPKAIEMALKYRLDLQTARDQVEDSRRAAANAKNGLLPDLDLSAQSEWNNRDQAPARQIDERTQTYSARLDLNLPIDRLAERNRYKAALIGVRQQQRDLDELRDRIVSEIRESLRSLQQSELSLQIQRQGIDLAQKRRENAYELLRSGKSTSTRDLVEAQNQLLRSRDAYEQARATQQIQILRFLRNSGTLRVDPAAGAIGHAMDRALGPISDRTGKTNNTPG